MAKLKIVGNWYNEKLQKRLKDGSYTEVKTENPLTGEFDITQPDPQKIVLVVKDKEMLGKVVEIKAHFDLVGLTSERIQTLISLDKGVTTSIPNVDYKLQRDSAGTVATKGIYKGEESHFFNFYYHVPVEPIEMEF